jgi:hypothetical protein
MQQRIRVSARLPKWLSQRVAVAVEQRFRQL